MVLVPFWISVMSHDSHWEEDIEAELEDLEIWASHRRAEEEALSHVLRSRASGPTRTFSGSRRECCARSFAPIQQFGSPIPLCATLMIY